MVISIVMVLLGFVYVFLNYYFALGKRSFSLVCFGAVLVAWRLYHLFHDDAHQIIHSLTFVSAGLVVVSVGLLAVYRLTPRR